MITFRSHLQLSKLVVAIAAIAIHQLSQAGALTDAFARARKFDSVFQAAKAELEANNVASQASSVAYFPQFQGTYSQLEVESSSRQTYTISQPLINATAYATLKETEPRKLLATATFQLREQELSQRLLKAVSDIVRSSESLRLNKAKIDALAKTAQSAARAYELGQGTITDVRDAQVRLEQSRADNLSLEALISSGQRTLSSITGGAPGELIFSIPRKPRAVSLKPLEKYLVPGKTDNPKIVIAAQNGKMADLAVTKADGAFLPVLSAIYTATSTSASSNDYAGVTVNFPVQVGSYFQKKSAVAGATRAYAQLKDAEQQGALEVQRLWSLVNSGRSELAIRLSAIASAELSVEATEKSFNGGVRSQIDVLNSIQTLFQVQQEYVNAVLNMSENYLNLLLAASVPADEAMAQVQTVLLP